MINTQKQQQSQFQSNQYSQAKQQKNTKSIAER